MSDFIWAGLTSLLLVVGSAAMFCEILALVWTRLPRLQGRPRLQIVLTLLCAFLGHTLTVWMFALGYYLLDTVFHMGTLKGMAANEGFFQYLYFSCVAYSSLGLGDVYPTGALRLVMGVEGIIGLMLIGWSVTFTYLVTQQYLIRRGGKDHPLLKR